MPEPSDEAQTHSKDKSSPSQASAYLSPGSLSTSLFPQIFTHKLSGRSLILLLPLIFATTLFFCVLQKSAGDKHLVFVCLNMALFHSLFSFTDYDFLKSKGTSHFFLEKSELLSPSPPILSILASFYSNYTYVEIDHIILSLS